ncbi:MAG: DUF3082 domain-containing protein [Prochlorothrix sp.]|nr:DUF3082 domain-containing protein [Prochlorothrix sp.]
MTSSPAPDSQPSRSSLEDRLDDLPDRPRFHREVPAASKLERSPGTVTTGNDPDAARAPRRDSTMDSAPSVSPLSSAKPIDRATDQVVNQVADQPSELSLGQSRQADPAALSEQSIAPSIAASAKAPPTVLQCISGAAMAGGFTVLSYRLTQSMAQSFAAKPILAKSYLAANIGAAVRTLVVGSVTLATFLFAISTLGLLALGVQTLIQGSQAPKSQSTKGQVD